jgi:hypothetical protein
MAISSKKHTKKNIPDPLLTRHNAEMARAAASSISGNHAETMEICSDLLTSDLYKDMEAAGNKEAARRGMAEVRLLLGSAMHFNDGTYEDIVRVLTYALDAPTDVRKDALFTLAVVHLSFDHRKESEAAMERCLVEIHALMQHKDISQEDKIRLGSQLKEAQDFLKELHEHCAN